jgi:hypothetical protein
MTLTLDTVNLLVEVDEQGPTGVTALPRSSEHSI